MASNDDEIRSTRLARNRMRWRNLEECDVRNCMMESDYLDPGPTNKTNSWK